MCMHVSVYVCTCVSRFLCVSMYVSRDVRVNERVCVGVCVCMCRSVCVCMCRSVCV